MKLEDQLAKLAELGLKLNDGITVDDLLYSHDREEYEERPFDRIMFVLGIEVEREPWGRSVCSRVWNFDTECVEESGVYIRIIKRICEVAGDSDCLTDISDYVNMDTGEAWVKYTVNGRVQKWDVEVCDDWADTLVLAYVMDDIQHDPLRFFFINNGQSMVLYYLDPATAAALNELSNNTLKIMP